jgi:hypothetical protein
VLLLAATGCEDEEPTIRRQRAPTTTPFTYTQPEGWRRQSSPDPMSLLTLWAEDDLVKITVSTFSGPAGGIEANVVRWQGQVKVEPAKNEKDVQELLQEFQVAGMPAHYVDLGKEGGLRILGVILPTKDATWFFKLLGPYDLAGEQEQAFKDFVQSVQFNGAENGQ